VNRKQTFDRILRGRAGFDSSAGNSFNWNLEMKANENHYFSGARDPARVPLESPHA
jgi:hypothetical protein